MTPNSLLLKFNRAHQHLQELEGEVQRWLTGNHYSVATKPDSERPYYVVLVTAEPIPFDPFAVLISDVLHNLRSGLDHIAYTLAANFTIPLPQEIAEQSEFPIFGDVDRKGQSGAGARLFRDSGLRKIRGVAPAAQAIIESLQPYHRGHGFVSDPLWKLHELSRIDKHRLFHPIAYHFTGAILDPYKSFNAQLSGTISVYGGPVERDTKIVRYPAEPVNPGLEMHVDFKPAIGIAFPMGSVAANEEIVGALAGIYNHIVQQVLSPLVPFL